MSLIAPTYQLKDALKTYFGYDQFKGAQQQIIENVLAGRNTFVLMPTGGGKSLCYQLPSLILPGTSIIVSPLIALMKNQVDAVRGFSQTGQVAHFLNSSLTKAEIAQVKADVLSGNTKMLYVAPESLTKQENIDFLAAVPISFFAIDEAHCISEWGHDFRPEYRRLREIFEKISSVPIIALTATATPKVQHDIQKNLNMLDADVFKSSFNRDNLYYEIRPKREVEKQIIRYIKQHEGQSGIIYCLSRKKVEEIAELLQVNGINALPYHAGLDASSRARHQDAFLMEEVEVIVATIAFGMGIDKPNVRFVLHYDVPASPEAYFQEAGRAGRDSAAAYALLFYNDADLEGLAAQNIQRFPAPERVLYVYRALANYLKIAVGSGKDEAYPFDLTAFCQTFELKEQEVFYALKLLEQNGNISLSESFFQQTRAQIIVSNEVLYNFQIQSILFVPTEINKSYFFYQQEVRLVC